MNSKSNIVNPLFEEEFYKGQDIVNYGSMIPCDMNPLEVLSKWSRNARRKIYKFDAIQADASVKFHFEALENKHLPELRKFWFNPDDVTFPNILDTTIGSAHLGFVCYYGNNLAGGIIWRESGDNLYLSQLIANKFEMDLDVPSILVWHSVKHFNKKQDYKKLDIGVSYNPNRQRFMQDFAIERYPVILKPPFYKLVIRFSPFRGFGEETGFGEDGIIMRTDRLIDQKDITFVPRASYGLYALLKYLNLKPDDDVVILKTFPTTFISSCVTKQIEKVCKWHIGKEGESLRGQIILMIHEFGIASQNYSNEFIKNLQETGAIVIEDCAWRLNKVYPASNYAVFSAQKMFNMNFGGHIQGVKLSDEFLWSIGCLDTFKRAKYSFGSGLQDSVLQRVLNYEYYDNMVRSYGLKPAPLMALRLAVEPDWIQTVYFHDFNTDEQCIAIKERLENFGIQSGVYWGHGILYVPIHQNMTTEELEYMFAVITGYFNLCKDYHGK